MCDDRDRDSTEQLPHARRPRPFSRRRPPVAAVGQQHDARGLRVLRQLDDPDACHPAGGPDVLRAEAPVVVWVAVALEPPVPRRQDQVLSTTSPLL